MSEWFQAYLLFPRTFGTVLTNLAVWYLRNPPIPRFSEKLLSSLGASLGEGARIKRSFAVDNSMTDENSTGNFSHLTIGSNTYVGDETYVDLADEVRIGDDVTIGGQVSIITHADCNRSPWLAEQYPRKQGPVTIEEGAWVGFGATIMHGVTVAEESIVASGAVLREDTEPRTVYGGTPAEKIDEID